MTRFLKNLCWLALLGLCAQSAWAFVPGGPIGNGPDAYQTPTIGYGIAGDLDAPKNIGEEYRRNTPVMYYAFDQTFWEFFGPEGVQAVDQAYAILNNLTNVSQYSSGLTEFPLNSQRINYAAAALSLTDVKSVVLGAMMEQLGLSEPARWVWALRARVPGSQCPFTTTYWIIKRNLDIVPSAPDQYQFSSYVNGTLYSYWIYEICSGPFPIADAVEFPVDPLATPYTAVADYISLWYEGLNLDGGYFQGLTRDDVAALRYLLQTNNYNIESTGPGTFQFVTNYTTQQLLTTLSLAQLQADGMTNDDLALAALYPGLQFSAPATLDFTNVGVPNIVGYFTNSPYAPAGSPVFTPVLATNGWTTNIVQFYVHHYANIVTNSYSPKSIQLLIVSSTVFNPLSPAGSPGTTNTQVYPLLSQVPTGEFYIIPTNACDIRIVRNQLTTVTAVTNPVSSITFGFTNLTITNSGGTTTTSVVAQTTQSIVTYVTNHTFVINPVTCPTDTIDRRQGIEKLTFVRRDYDSLLNQAWAPVTNDYTMVALTNSTLVTQRIRRVITQPDFLFTAADLLAGGFARNLNFNQASNLVTGLAGPGTIEPPTFFTFNKDVPIYGNAWFFVATNSFFLTEAQQIPVMLWGSFDGTTNAPVVYPNGTSVTELENMLLMAVTTTALPDATVGASYTTQLAGTGGQTPYTWSIPSNPPGNLPQGGLPAGLTLGSDGTISGTPAPGSGGTFPTAAVTYDFTVQMTDTYGRSVDAAVSITVNRQ